MRRSLSKYGRIEISLVTSNFSCKLNRYSPVANTKRNQNDKYIDGDGDEGWIGCVPKASSVRVDWTIVSPQLWNV